MNFPKTNLEISKYNDAIKSIQRYVSEAYEKYDKIHSDKYLETYSFEKQEEDTRQIIAECTSASSEYTNSLTEYCKKIKECFETEKTAKSDTTTALQLCLQYFSTVKNDMKPEYMQHLMKPVFEAEDVAGYEILHELLKGKHIKYPEQIVRLSVRTDILKKRIENMQKNIFTATRFLTEPYIRKNSGDRTEYRNYDLEIKLSSLLRFDEQTQKMLTCVNDANVKDENGENLFSDEEMMMAFSTTETA